MIRSHQVETKMTTTYRFKCYLFLIECSYDCSCLKIKIPSCRRWSPHIPHSSQQTENQDL